MKWFGRREKPMTAAERLAYDERMYRAQRLAEIADLIGQSVEAAGELADRWVIQTVSTQIGGDAPFTQYIPHPIWDDEWMMSRSAFPTREEAEAEIVRMGGKPLTGR